MFSVNQEAVKLVKEEIIPKAEQLNVEILHLNNGTTVIDMGVNKSGSLSAGILFTEATFGGLGWAQFGYFKKGEINLPSIDVYIDKPREGTLSSQFSGWKLPRKDLAIAPIGSGPARAIAKNDIFSQCVEYQDNHHEVVFGAQTTILPDEEITSSIAKQCNISPENLYVLAATTGSLVGTIQVCSRTVEATMWRLYKKGFDIYTVISGIGTCPIPPQTKDELVAMDRVNTALIYGASVHYIVDWDDNKIEKIIKELPFSASKRFGTSFLEIFEEGERDFYKVDKDVHTIAHYTISNINSGRTFSAGIIREDILESSFFRTGRQNGA